MPHAATCDAAWNSDMGEFSEPRHQPDVRRRPTPAGGRFLLALLRRARTIWPSASTLKVIHLLHLAPCFHAYMHTCMYIYITAATCCMPPGSS